MEKLVQHLEKLATSFSVCDLFECLKGEYPFLLQSSDESGGRFSYIGVEPYMVAVSEAGVLNLENRREIDADGFVAGKQLRRQIMDGDSLENLKILTGKYKLDGATGDLDRGFLNGGFMGGAVGFFSYDYGCKFVEIEQKTFDEQNGPDFVFAFYDRFLFFDHQTNEAFILALAKSKKLAQQKCFEFAEMFNQKKRFVGAGRIGDVKSNLNKEKYLQKIEEIKELIRAGETYQVNFAQRFKAECSLDAWGIYRKVVAASMAPYSCFFEYPKFSVVSFSPELLVQKHGENVVTLPIKGTIARGKNKFEDQKKSAELLASKKDEAELNMIVDLERNDLGKVCTAGTVQVIKHRAVQILSHVIHTYSEVGGILAKGRDFYDLFKAIYPGGSITGCPKKRTMQIIDELEDYKRGVYTGSAGFIGFNGDAVLNIMIRTMLFKDGELYFSAGGGITIDSNGESEYQETINKVQNMFEVIGMP